MKQEIFEHKSVEYVIKIGQNKQDNFYIIDLASPSDIWFHVEGIPSCHVILQTEEKIRNIPHKVLHIWTFKTLDKKEVSLVFIF